MTADDIWDQGSATLRDQLAPATWAAWFHGVRPLSYDGDHLLLSVPSSLAAERIRSSYSGMLTDAIRDSTGVTVHVELLVETAPNPKHPYGAKGVGEVPIVPPLAAVANAVRGATGIRMADLPISPPKMLAALDAKGG